jgi:hypothetical protein
VRGCRAFNVEDGEPINVRRIGRHAQRAQERECESQSIGFRFSVRRTLPRKSTAYQGTSNVGVNMDVKSQKSLVDQKNPEQKMHSLP